MKHFFRWLGIILASLLGLALMAVALVFGLTEARLRKTYQIAIDPPTLPTDAATIARGRILAAATHCTGCHAADLRGMTLIDAPPFLVIPPNLTSGAGGIGGRYNDADWVRAIRHGVRPDGTPLLIMPAHNLNQLSEADLAAIIAYVKSVPPVEHQLGKTELRPLGRALMLLGELPPPSAEIIDHSAPPPPAIPVGRTVEYGRYLTVLGNCADCHGSNLSGQPTLEPDAPPAANLTPGGELRAWTEADFILAMREGVTPGGRKISEAMPWELTGKLSDEELGAIYLYLQSLPAQPYNTSAK